MSGPYLVAAAVLESDFVFAGDANAQDEEGSGNFLAVGYRFFRKYRCRWDLKGGLNSWRVCGAI